MTIMQKMIVFMILGGLVLYVGLDMYMQTKTNLSLIQMIKIAQTDLVKPEDGNKSKEVDVFYLTINGFEHNFTFQGVNFDSISIDGVLLQKVKRNKRRKETQ